MKKIILISSLFLLTSATLFVGCKKESATTDDSTNNTSNNNNNNTNTTVITPNAFSVDIPSAICETNNKRLKAIDPLSPAPIYANLRTFIGVGNFSALFVKSIIAAIAIHKITDVITLTYTDTQGDGRVKTLAVTKSQLFEGKTYQYKLTISDAKGLAFELFWDRSPIFGTAILYPWYMNNKTTKPQDSLLMYRVDYAEKIGLLDKRMIVTISDLGKSNPVDSGYINNLKMYVGVNGDNMDIWGNSNHPLLKIIDPNATGYNYAFTAHCSPLNNVAVAQVGLPPNTLATNDSLLTTYSPYRLLKNFLNKVFIPDTTSERILANVKSPGYFTSAGFVSCGKNVPSNPAFSTSMLDLSAHKPYIPLDIKNLKVKF